jgi:hypothetical protein
MKTKRLNFRKVTAVAACLAFTTMFFGCEKEELKVPTQPKNQIENLQYVRTELGGCNLQQSFLLKGETTITITISGDSVSVFVNLYYQCKNAPFETQIEIIDEIIYMYIIDLCEDVSACYYRCMCDYTFDFIFTSNGEINQKYKLLLIDPREEKPIIITEGTIY